MNQMEAAQRNFLDAQRRWNADEKGEFRLLEVCSDAEQQLLAAFFDGWKANMRLKNLVYSHFRKALIENDIELTWCAASKDIAFLNRFNFGQSAAGGNRFAKDLLAQAQLLR
jgi:hypothetical protein